MTNGLFQPYRKPNDEPFCINTKSDRPPTVSKQISAAINCRLSVLSSNKESFDKAKPLYDKAFRSSGVYEILDYRKRNTVTAPTKRNIILFNPHTAKMTEPKSLQPSTHTLHTLFFFFLQNNLDYIDPQIANLLFEAGQSSTNIIYNI